MLSVHLQFICKHETKITVAYYVPYHFLMMKLTPIKLSLDEHTELQSLTVDKLRALLRDKGLSATGRKASIPVSMDLFSRMTVTLSLISFIDLWLTLFYTLHFNCRTS